MRFETSLKPTSSLIDLTPLVDVLFLLLVFFIVTSDTLPLKSLKISRPRLDFDSAALTTQLAIMIDAEHVIYLGSERAIVDPETLGEELSREVERYVLLHGGQRPTILLNVDKEVQYDIFLRVFNEVQKLGLSLRLAYKEAN